MVLSNLKLGGGLFVSLRNESLLLTWFGFTCILIVLPCVTEFATTSEVRQPQTKLRGDAVVSPDTPACLGAICWLENPLLCSDR